MRTFLSAVFWNSLLIAAALPLSIVTSIVIGRWLGPAGKGEYTLAGIIGALLFTLLNLGIPTAISYYLGSGRLPAASLVKTVLGLALLLSVLAWILVFVVDAAGVSPRLFGIPRLTPAVWLALGALPFQFAGTFLLFVVLAEGRRVLFAAVQTSGQAVVSLGVAVFLGLDILTPFTAVGASFASYACTAVFLALYLERRLHWFRAPLLASADCKQLARYSALTHAAHTLQFLVQRADVLLISVLLDLRAVGLYSVAYGVAELLLLLPQRIGNLYVPRVAGRQAPDKPDAEIPVSSSMVFLGVVAAGTALALLAPFAIRFFYGTAFAPSVTPFLLLLPGVGALAASSIHAAYLSGLGRVKINAAVAAAGLVLNLALNLLLIPRYGISGAALASSAAYCVQALWIILAVARLTRARPLDMFASAPPAVLFGLLKRSLR